MELNQDYSELLKILNEYKVQYLIIGAYAVIYYTDPRYTKDMDIWVKKETENIKGLYKALAKFGAPLEKIAEEDFMKKDIIYQMGIEPVRIDILTNLFGIDFEKAWKTKSKTKYGDIGMNIIDLDNLIKSKKKAGRAQDKIDIKKLLMVKKKKA